MPKLCTPINVQHVKIAAIPTAFLVVRNNTCKITD